MSPRKKVSREAISAATPNRIHSKATNSVTVATTATTTLTSGLTSPRATSVGYVSTTVPYQYQYSADLRVRLHIVSAAVPAAELGAGSLRVPGGHFMDAKYPGDLAPSFPCSSVDRDVLELPVGHPDTFQYSKGCVTSTIPNTHFWSVVLEQISWSGCTREKGKVLR
ncbi:hypothetical protein B9Z19DRAFT_369077 [Tuber borchii]|uniref:Uncharacterized protein n=1 Tax=Tuber borchii TaxID=42251 RepID=A0A2T6ZI14_TUBBO|nr:hypothetical protein B9Z19DRAFT_369077 [Tuber borchii]